MSFRVWPKDEFDDADADEREDSAMALEYDCTIWSADKRRGERVLRCPLPIDTARDAARVYADWFHGNRDGWECTWPLEFVVHDGERYFVVEVEREMVPEFLAGKPQPLEVTP